MPAGGVWREAFVTNGGTVVANWRHAYDQPTRPVRWRSAESAPELFPVGDAWRDATITDLNNRGEAIGRATRSHGTPRFVRWDLA